MANYERYARSHMSIDARATVASTMSANCTVQDNTVPKRADLILFDIDGTILKGNSVHRQAFCHGFDEIYGLGPTTPGFVSIQCRRNNHVNRNPASPDYMCKEELCKYASLGDLDNHAGGIDVPLVALVCRAYGVQEETIWRRMPEMINFMNDYVKESLQAADDDTLATVNKTLYSLPGIHSLLQILNSHGIPMGLVTGNLEPIAYMKVDQVGLRKYFKFGGFGSDLQEQDVVYDFYKDRATVIRKSLCKYFKSGVPEYDASPSCLRIIHVGDTPSDVEAAHLANVESLAVATGKFRKEELLNHHPTFCVENFENAEYLVKNIFGL
eukprot:Nk52_evm25s211 gene=Nk52_evmTU25s211